MANLRTSEVKEDNLLGLNYIRGSGTSGLTTNTAPVFAKELYNLFLDAGHFLEHEDFVQRDMKITEEMGVFTELNFNYGKNYDEKDLRIDICLIPSRFEISDFYFSPKGNLDDSLMNDLRSELHYENIYFIYRDGLHLKEFIEQSNRLFNNFKKQYKFLDKILKSKELVKLENEIKLDVDRKIENLIINNMF